MQNSFRVKKATFIETTSLKRSKAQFSRLSTRSRLQTTNRHEQNTIIAKDAPIFGSQSRNHQGDTQFREIRTRLFDSEISDNKAQQGNPQDLKQMIESIQTNIYSENKKRDPYQASKHVYHHYFNGLDKFINFNNFPRPAIVNEIYQEKAKNRKNSELRIHFQYGTIPDIGYIYYVIEDELILIRLQHYLCTTQTNEKQIPYSKMRMSKFSWIYQIISIPHHRSTNNAEQNKTLFPQEQNVLIFVCPWKLKFFGFRDKLYKSSTFEQFCPLIDLNTEFQLPIEKVEGIHCTEDGSIFYMDDKASLYEVKLQRQKYFGIFDTSRYTLKTYITQKSKFMDRRLRRTNLSLLRNIFGFFKDVAKNILTSTYSVSKIVHDQANDLFFVLVQKYTQSTFFRQKKVQILCYEVNKGKTALTQIISEQHLSDKIGPHLRFRENSFHIQSIHLTNTEDERTNLILVSKCGIMIYSTISSNNMIINEILRPPPLSMVPSIPEIPAKYSNISQRDFVQIVRNYSQKLVNNDKYNPNKHNSYFMGLATHKSLLVKKSLFYDQTFLLFLQESSRDDIKMLSIQNRGFSSINLINGECTVNQVQFTSLSKQKKSQILSESSIHQISTSCLNAFNLQNQVNPVIKNLNKQQRSQSSPKIFLLQSVSNSLLMAQLRSIDVVFTILLLSTTKQSTSIMNLPEIVQKCLILKKNEGKTSIFGIEKIDPCQFCSMLLKICYDKSAHYLFSLKFATQVLFLDSFYTNSQYNKKQDMVSYNKNSRQSFELLQNKKICHLMNQLQVFPSFFSSSQIASYAPSLGNSCKSLIEQIISGQFKINRTLNSQIQPTTQLREIEYQKTLDFRSQMFLIYLGDILKPIWNEQIRNLNKKQIYEFFKQQISFVERAIKDMEAEFKFTLSEDLSSSSLSDYKNLDYLLKFFKQFLLLLRQLEILPQTLKFGQCISDFFSSQNSNRTVNGLFDWIIIINVEKYFHKQIVQKWKKVFPSLFSSTLHKMMSIIGQIEQAKKKNAYWDKEDFCKELSESKALKSGLPLFFITQVLIKKYRIDGFHLRKFFKPSHFTAVYCLDGSRWNYQKFKSQNQKIKHLYVGLLAQNSFEEKKSNIPEQIEKIVKKYRQLANETVDKSKVIKQQSQVSDLRRVIEVFKESKQIIYGDELEIGIKLSILNQLKTTIPIIGKSMYKKINNISSRQIQSDQETNVEKDISEVHSEIYKQTILQEFEHLHKIITIQHQIYQHYCSKIKEYNQEQPNKNKEALKADQTTQELLKYQFLDIDMLQNLVISALDNKLVLMYYSIFAEKDTLCSYQISKCQQKKSNIQKYGEILSDYCEQFVVSSEFSQISAGSRLQQFLGVYFKQICFKIASLSSFSDAILSQTLKTVQKYLIHLDEPVDISEECRSDIFGIQHQISAWMTFKNPIKHIWSQTEMKKNGLRRVFMLTDFLLKIGYSPESIFQSEVFSMQEILHRLRTIGHFQNSNSPLQINYWLKWINCYYLICRYFLKFPSGQKVIRSSSDFTQPAEDSENINNKTKPKNKNKQKKNSEAAKFISFSKQHMRFYSQNQKYKDTDIGIRHLLDNLENLIQNS